ncbi:MAG: hypothetical protein Q8R15_05310, partial [Candidatus Micrarchaeota archaeon]|nr:hypothetical protein [Candidatus Micrarchaeota archaeon]
MRRFLVYFIAFLLILPSVVFADSFATSVSSYGEQFEAGQINYLQFSVLLNNEREKLFDTLNGDEATFRDREDDEENRQEFRGWDQDKMRQLFGEPTQFEQWAWSPLVSKSVKLTSPVAVWRKTLYDGSKIKVSLDSWPQVIQRDGQTNVFYNFDLRSDYKESEDFNIEQMINAFKNLAQSSVGNSEKQKEAALKAVEFEKQLQDYLQNNKRQCRETLAGWFGYSASESNKLKWSATLFEGESVTVKLAGDEMTDQDWHWVNSWIDVQHRLEMAVVNQQIGEANFGYSASGEYTAKMREIINELKRGAANLDANPSPDNLHFVESQRQQYEQVVNEFMKKVGRREFDISNDEAIAEIEKIFVEQNGFSKENVKQFEFKQRLLNFSREVTSSYCSGNEISCGELLTCSNAVSCVESTCGDVRCGPCQYQDRTTCTCVQARDCVPRDEVRPFEGEFPQNQTQVQPQWNQTQVQPQWNQTEQLPRNESNQATVNENRTSVTGSGDGTCDCPANPMPMCQAGYSAISTQYEYDSPTCSSYVLTCWRTTCQPDPSSNSTTASAKENRLLQRLYSPLTGLVVEEQPVEGQSPSICNPSQCNNPNQVCGSQAWCECSQGFWDCDGDWLNGCESTKQCKQCTTNRDCAIPRCSEDHGRVVNFECKQGEVHSEETGGVEFAGNCAERNSGEFEAGVWLGAWGDDFQQFEQFKQQAWSANDAKRCEAELGQAKRKRIELQSSLNDEFFKWFFDNFVSTNPNDFEKQGKAIRGIYESFQHNSDETARALR